MKQNNKKNKQKNPKIATRLHGQKSKKNIIDDNEHDEVVKLKIFYSKHFT